ncbi:phosphocholine cytidylyltransferase family protein [Angustibacter luteus]|uniref:Phosphocholine cytidylyltransferase family protein n=1 Tax=Angustibacter luteus TaxID=658456 RepID=A0ABW1JH59_9ACTN
MDAVQATILAAGMGTRLGRPFPKPLTPLEDGRSILAQQLANLTAVFGDRLRLTVVVGFKHESVMEAVPDVLFAYNENFDRTNTCKSLLKALRSSHDGPVLWMNGDVVFDPEVLRRLQPYLDGDHSAIAVNTSAVADEEVKYTLDDEGFVKELSKTVVGGLGESVGINVIAGVDKPALLRGLEDCDDQDYFERGIQLAVERDGVRVAAVDISDLFAVEVDFEEDLTRANAARRADPTAQ